VSFHLSVYAVTSVVYIILHVSSSCKVRYNSMQTLIQYNRYDCVLYAIIYQPWAFVKKWTWNLLVNSYSLWARWNM